MGVQLYVLNFKAVFFSFGEEVCGFGGSGKKGHACCEEGVWQTVWVKG